MNFRLHILCWLTAFSLFFFSCGREESSRSQLFAEIFKDQQSTFRGTNLGDDISVPKQNELPQVPKYIDSLGIVYEYGLVQGDKLFVEYFKDKNKEEENANQVAAIIANVYLEDEITTSQLYNEIQTYLNSIEDYGLSSGSYGNYFWESRTKNNNRMEIYLKLDDTKKGITLNFIETKY
ncbi:MAG: hypothetical protein AAGC85_25210 [Bacteroidota bacterium]